MTARPLIERVDELRDALRDGYNGACLRHDRAALGWSQRQLGAALGIPTNTIARWERGECRMEHPRLLSLALDALKPRH